MAIQGLFRNTLEMEAQDIWWSPKTNAKLVKSSI